MICDSCIATCFDDVKIIEFTCSNCGKQNNICEDCTVDEIMLYCYDCGNGLSN